jgi:histidinol-phosphate/aromatic aminotransferase/cobyric acid decarboxylase-like protein
VVFIDEAYFEFSGVTALGQIERSPNLFVSRTFSKVYGMAAMRLGCLFSHPANIAYLHKAQSPYSVNTLAVLAAQAADPRHGAISRITRPKCWRRASCCASAWSGLRSATCPAPQISC